MTDEERQVRHEEIEARMAHLHELANLLNHAASVINLEHKIVDVQARLDTLTKRD